MNTLQTLKENSQNLKILYIEDDDFLREKTTKLFFNIFNFIEVAVDGEDGLLKYQLEKEKNGKYFDIVITDINMPKKNGIDMSKEILNINQEQIIIITSAYNESEYLHQAIELGIFAFITKPLQMNTLINTLSKVFEFINYINNKNELIELERIKSINFLLKSITHHWRQPLNTINIVAANLLDMYELNELNLEKMKSNIQTITDTTQNLSKVISAFSNISKIDKNKTDINLINLLKESINLIQSEYIKEKIIIKTNFHSENIYIYNELYECKRIFLVILQNSYEAILKKYNLLNLKNYQGEIIINTFQNNDNKLVIEIIDNGIGI